MKKSGAFGAGRIFIKRGVQSICQSFALNAFGMSGPQLGAARSEQKYCKIMRIACIMAILVVPLSAQEKAVDVRPASNFQSETQDPAFVQVPEDPHLPRVLIIGDSISMGYTWEVRKFLSAKANVQHPAVNCGPTEFGYLFQFRTSRP
jgi:hypothetical protein